MGEGTRDVKGSPPAKNPAGFCLRRFLQICSPYTGTNRSGSVSSRLKGRFLSYSAVDDVEGKDGIREGVIRTAMP